MVLEKKYDSTPLQVLTDTPTRERLRKLAEAMSQPGQKKVSQAEVFRKALEIALPVLEGQHGLGE